MRWNNLLRTRRFSSTRLGIGSSSGIVDNRVTEMNDSTKMLDDKVITGPFKQERAEVDTKPPFESVRAAVSLFGERADHRKPRFHEKGAARDVDLLHAQEELLKVREQLANAEEVKAKALHELEEASKSFEKMAEKLKETDKSSVTEVSEAAIEKVEQTEQGPMNIQEKHIVWEAQYKVTKEKHMTALTELENERQELADMKKELLASSKEKDAVLKQTERALASAEDNSKRAEYITTELAGNNESLVLLKLACIEANKEKLALLEGKRTVTKGLSSDNANELEVPNQELQMANELECKFLAMINESESLQAEMISVKDGEVKLASVATIALANLKALQIEVERTSMSGESASASLGSLSIELEEAKVTLKKESDNKASLLALLESLQTESEMMKKELMGLKEREANATAAAAVLSGELARIRMQLTAAVEAQGKATESISDLSHAFEQVQAEAAEAKGEAEAWQEQAIKAISESDQAKAALENAENMLQNALQESDLAKASEAAAINQVKSLIVKMNATRVSEVESGSGITISQDEYNSLKRKVQEAEELANMRVAAAMAQIEAIRVSEEEILWKVAIATEDMNSIKSGIGQALNRAEMAVAAKSAVEAELKRLREREHRQREKGMAMTPQQHRTWNGDTNHSSSFTPIRQAEPLANLLNLNMDSERSQKLGRTATQTQKKPFLNSLKSYLSRRKSFAGDFK